MMLKKRGFTLMAAIKIALGVSFALLLLWFAHEKGTGVDFEKVYLARDIATTINALHGIPGDAVIDYDNAYMQQFKNTYDINVRESIVGVQRHSTEAGRYAGPFPAESVFGFEATYPYGEVEAYPIQFYAQSPSYLAFVLAKGRIDIKTTRTEPEATGCPEAETSADIKQQTLLFEAGQYEGNPGNTADSLEEYKLTKQIAESIRMQCRAKGYNCRFVQQQELGSKITEIKDTTRNMFISIHIGSDDAGKNPAIIFLPLGDQKSAKLACIISNRFRPDFDPVETKQVDAAGLEETDNLNVLEPGGSPAVCIEAGNIKKTGFMRDSNNIAKIAKSIIEGIEEYYK